MKKTLYFLIFIIFLLLNLSTCEEIFTASPFSGLDRDPSDFDLDRKIEYAEQALASGNLTYIKKAFDALDAENSTDGEVCLLTAICANELAGMPEIYSAMYGDSEITLSSTTNLDDLNDFANDLNKTYLTAAATNYRNAVADNADMNATDYFFAGLCELFDTSTDLGSLQLLAASTNTAYTDRTAVADGFLEDSSDRLSDGNQVKVGIDDFRTDILSNFNYL